MIALCKSKIVTKKFYFFFTKYKHDKSRSIKDYEIKPEGNLIKILSEPKPKINLSKKKIKEIKKDFSELRYGFSKSKINEFRKSHYNITSLSAAEIKDTEKKSSWIRKSLFKLKKYYDYYNTEYQGVRDIGNLVNRNLFDEIDKDCYKLKVLLMVIT